MNDFFDKSRKIIKEIITKAKHTIKFGEQILNSHESSVNLKIYLVKQIINVKNIIIRTFGIIFSLASLRFNCNSTYFPYN